MNRLREEVFGYHLVSVAQIAFGFVIAFAVVVWAGRRPVQRDVLPRKRRLEALLKELDGP